MAIEIGLSVLAIVLAAGVAWLWAASARARRIHGRAQGHEVPLQVTRPSWPDREPWWRK